MTSSTRRSLLLTGAVGLVLAPVLVAPEVYAATTTRRDLYSRSRFSALRRRTFRLDGAGRHWRVKLTRVGNLPSCRRKDDHAFSLTFRSSAAGPEQGSYVLRRAGFKPTTLFLVPSDSGRRTYEAVVFRKS
jgi:uncharacterized protein DUF6916